ncbi:MULTISPECIES: hypothetical protein [unclassified Acidovorax]|uniref:DUF7660 family protein n=1 Tax=unclassified Acidovorax TaxID=2684926 RepID=UPI001C491060|nr:MULTISPECIES: hypothetical protein [unclassified Acidovorax]MBV7459403.1 hypothetical protein [Acidovorax sp. sif0632]MBV7464428.1 hypothetical protein [Acidovorax sp. sif0613]
MNLQAQLDRVVDQDSFLAFAHALAKDRIASVEARVNETAEPHGRDAGGWENTSIESFLEGAIAWAEDSNFGAHQGLATSSPWKQFAVFLYCGKIYE